MVMPANPILGLGLQYGILDDDRLSPISRAL